MNKATEEINSSLWHSKVCCQVVVRLAQASIPRLKICPSLENLRKICEHVTFFISCQPQVQPSHRPE
jgi:hypothetical protein